jgi:hypothetical protein
MNQFHTFTSDFSKQHFNIILPFMRTPLKQFIPTRQSYEDSNKSNPRRKEQQIIYLSELESVVPEVGQCAVAV